MNQPVQEPPVMGLSREEMMRIALATRTLASLLREARERRGRAAWDDTSNAVRKRGAAEKQSIGRFTNADLDEWNAAAAAGGIDAELHPESGMTIRVAPLSGGRVGVQAGWQEHHAETVAGSREMADRIVDWLRTHASHETVDDLHDAAEELHYIRADARSKGSETRNTAGEGAQSEFVQARAWVAQYHPDWYSEWNLRYINGDTADGRRLDESELIRYWREKQRSAGSSGHNAEERQRTPMPLADRLRGRVPDRVLDDARWTVAEEQFAALTAEGADPDQLAEAVAAVDFDSGKVRAPSGFAAWVMRDAVKNGRARKNGATEDEARRDVAQEWLDAADPDSPFDRARAAMLVGEIDEQFDSALAQKFPGILDGEGATDERAKAEGVHGEGSEQAASQQEESTTVFVVDQDGVVVEVPFEPAERPTADSGPEPQPGPEQANAAGPQTASAEAAQAVMTPPGQDDEKKQRRRRTAPPAGEPARQRTRGRSH